MIIGNRQVLLISVRPDIVEALPKLLVPLGFSTTVVASVEEAFVSMSEQPAQILIYDSITPGGQTMRAVADQPTPAALPSATTPPALGSSASVARRLRDEHLEHPFYFLAIMPNLSADEVSNGVELDIDDFLVEPIGTAALAGRLRVALRILELEERIVNEGRTDPLTKVMSRRALFEQFARECGRAARYQTSIVCVMLDVDHFKSINDTYGHPAGDEVLMQVADVIQTNCRNSDLVGRYGGDEFCVVLPTADERAGVIWANRIREKVAAAGLLAASRLRVTISAGVAAGSVDCAIAEMLVESADQALLAAKQLGRNRVVGRSTMSTS